MAAMREIGTRSPEALTHAALNQTRNNTASLVDLLHQLIAATEAKGITLRDTANATKQSMAEQRQATLRKASWASPELRRRYRVPNDPPALVTALSDERDAVKVATLHAVLWASTRRLRALTVPVDQGYAVDLGNRFTLTLPEHPDRTLSGLVVGEQLRPVEATITLQVLVGDQG